MKDDWTPPQGTKITFPWIGVDHPDYKFKTGADVQSLWRKYGWTPPSEGRPAPPEPPQVQEKPLKPLRLMRHA